ncbi:MAG: cobalamin biosynthesis protein [Dehalococcoidia bacterium]|nr:cobalamin biosynthesis protein [Dehalococcoidia bacterium]
MLREMKKVSLFLTALAVDLRMGEPPGLWHPVVWMGKAITLLERFAPVDSAKERRAYGVGMVAAMVALSSFLPRLLNVFKGVLFPAKLLGAILFLKSTFAVKALWDAAEEVRYCLDNGNAVGAREALHKLVSREVKDLTEVQVAAAAVESVAENLSDSFIAPLLYYRVAGLPGAMAYRAVNTLDAMIGYHGIIYEDLGKASAKFDDLLNYVPSRLSALLIIVASIFTSDDFIGGARAAKEYHDKTESPNAGWPMSAMAGAIGADLEKPGYYVLGGTGAQPDSGSITKALRIAGMAAGIGVMCYLASEVMVRGRKG